MNHLPKRTFAFVFAVGAALFAGKTHAADSPDATCDAMVAGMNPSTVSIPTASRTRVMLIGNHDICMELLKSLESSALVSSLFESMLNGESLNLRDQGLLRARLGVIRHAKADASRLAAFANFLKSNRPTLSTTSAAEDYIDDYEGLMEKILNRTPTDEDIGDALAREDQENDTVFNTAALRADLMEALGLKAFINEESLRALVDMPLTMVEAQFDKWTAQFAKYALNLLAMLFMVGLAFAAWKLVFGGLSPGEFVAHLVKMVIVASLYFALLSPSPWSAENPDTPNRPWVSELAQQLAVAFGKGVKDNICEAGRTRSEYRSHVETTTTDSFCDADSADIEDATIKPGFIVVRGIKKATQLVRIPLNTFDKGFFSFDSYAAVPMLFIGAFSFIIVSLLYFLMAIMVTLVWIEGYLVIAMGLFILAFGVVPEWRSKAEGYLWFIAGWAVRLSSMLIVYFFIDSAFFSALNSNEQISSMLDSSAEGETEAVYFASYLILCVVYILVPFFTTMLMHSIPNQLAGMVGGGSSSVGSNIVAMSSRVASMASVAVAAKGAQTFAKAGVTGVKGVAGTAKGVGAYVGSRREEASVWQSLKDGWAVGRGRGAADVAESRAPEPPRQP